jgi:capsular exopolysaccharide synthesis family protein
VWQAVRQWWLLATPCGIILAVAAAAWVWWSFVPVYQAVAWVQIQETQPFIAIPGVRDSARFVQTQIELIRSPLVLGSAVSRPSVAELPELQTESPLELMLVNVGVRTVGSSDLYHITYKSTNPVAAAQVANAVADAYLELQQSRANSQTQSMLGYLTRERDRRAAELEQLRERVRVLFAKVHPHAAYLPPGEKGDRDPSTSPLAREQSELMNAEVERAVLEARLKAYEKLVKDETTDVPGVMIDSAVEQRIEVQRLMAQIAAKESALKEYEKIASRGESDPGWQRLNKELAEMRQDLVATRKQLKPVVQTELEEAMRRERDEAAAMLQAQVKSQGVLEDILRERLNTKRQELEQGSDESLKLEFARADLARAEDVFRKISDRIFAMQTEKEAPARATLLTAATPPPAPMELFPLKKVGVAGLGGFMIPFLLAVLWEMRVRRIADPKQIQTELSLQVLGEITTVPMRSMIPGRWARERFERDRGTFEESIDSLRTSLMLAEDLGELQVLVVASAVSREGKTSVASQLAVSLANCCQEPTLLIDTDMRAPDLHDMFGISLEPGLAEYLSGQCSADEAIVTNWSKRVHLLPAGRLTHSPHALLNTPMFAELLERMRSRYRYIVVDAPPVLAASEAMTVAKLADGTLLCTMRDISRAPQLRLACQRLRLAGAHLLGAVLNGVPPKTYAYKYGGYEYYARRYRQTVDADFHANGHNGNGNGGDAGPHEDQPPKGALPGETS